MAKATVKDAGRGAVALLEDAVALLRAAPAQAWVAWMLGAFPFAVGGMYFMGDMSRGAGAEARLGASAWVMAMLFMVVKVGQARFCGYLRDHLEMREAGRGGWRLWRRTCVIQGILQSTGCVVLPVAFLAAAPFGWVWSFYQHLYSSEWSVRNEMEKGGVGGSEEGATVRGTMRWAMRQAGAWPGQAHLLILLLAVWAGVVWVNLAFLVYLVPVVVRMFTGIETSFTLSGWAFLNTTYFATVTVLTWLVCDPLVKAVYVVRGFEVDSVKSGHDLLSRWRRLAGRVTTGVIVGAGLGLGVGWSGGGFGGELRAGEAVMAESGTVKKSGERPRRVLAPERIDRAAAEVLARRDYVWREERGLAVAERSEGWWDRWVRRLDEWMSWVGEQLKSMARWVERALDWIFRRSRGGSARDEAAPMDWSGFAHGMLYLALGIGTAALVFWQIRVLRRRTEEVGGGGGEGRVTPPDLRDESVSAELLPESGWLALAREHAARGEYTLALRAMYLAALAVLAEREVVRIERHKTNGDYVREVERRSRHLPGVSAAFGETAGIFDRAWYGGREVTAEMVQEAELRLALMRRADR